MVIGATPSRHPLALPRTARLKQSREFARLKTGGRRIVSGCLILNWLPAAATSESRLGVVTSRKVGSAVARSRARRLLREVWRRRRSEWSAPQDMVLVARPSIAAKQFAGIDEDFRAALRRAGLTPKP